MAEVKLPAPVKSSTDALLLKQRWPTKHKFAAGATAFGGEPLRMWYVCPCGCGSVGGLRVYRAGTPAPQPKEEPTWGWNGDEQRPTLAPSINHVDHWHGYLRDGMFVNA